MKAQAAVLTVPVLNGGGTVLGVLEVRREGPHHEKDGTVRPFTQEDEALVTLVAHQTAFGKGVVLLCATLRDAAI